MSKEPDARLINFTNFEAADYLDSEEAIAEYLAAAKADENPQVYMSALKDAAQARHRMSQGE
ncbi:DNA-binding phage protein [Agrobacterium larrymoorei]|uniref:DNA-binding phage protein n=1 Tax=Agrobacterium larrymoorei TaxID=160699 RepID=A0AAJ2BBS3_9HYPH|nr:hypothetical protein [Agrobacterium larrymoorei]MDR6101028.1 DNA-binding phage protein [Agrobacterium larrymoorei]